MVILDNLIKFIGLLLLCILVRCGTTDISRSFDATQANRLLSADASKTWMLASKLIDQQDEFGPCVTDNSITFVKATAGDSLYILGRLITCGSTSIIDTLFKAKYTLSEDAAAVFQNRLVFSDEKHAAIGVMQVDELTSDGLRLTYTVDGVTVEDKYSH